VSARHRHWIVRTWRRREASLVFVAVVIAFLGFALVEGAARIQQGLPPLPLPWEVLRPPAVLALVLVGTHLLLRQRGTETEQLILPITGLLLALGLIMIWRLRGADGAWQQIWRGLLPGAVLAAVVIARPAIIERVRREWPLVVSLGGLALLMLTAFFGIVDESGARLALRLGPLPPVQTSEIIKLSLIVFLAWYIESEWEEAEARAIDLGWLKLPALRYFVPGVLFVLLAILALVRMADLGAILILGTLFVAMLYAGFQPRLLVPIATIGLLLSVLAGMLLAFVWEVPDVVQHRLAGFRDPWSQEPLLVDGVPTGLTIAEGPGYQIQQAVYATVAGGLTGTGLGFGSPQNIPLAHSEFILAAIVEELGIITGLAVLALFVVLCWRILRLAILLPEAQMFERLLLIGIGIHFFTQVFVMGAGTFNLLPLTGITVPFMSLGGVALMVNLFEVGLALALAQRLAPSERAS
jgi:cell division protein FtsW (lipid II flippase)